MQAENSVMFCMRNMHSSSWTITHKSRNGLSQITAGEPIVGRDESFEEKRTFEFILSSSAKDEDWMMGL